MTVSNPNVGLAFALVIGAGFSTALGAAVVFIPSLVKLASRRVLASALGFSAGVMTYVSFVEIFQKSKKAFVNHGYSESDSYIYGTLCFFGGVVVMLILDVVVHALSGHDGHGHGHDHDHHLSDGNSETHACVDHVVEKDTDVCVVTHTCLAFSPDPVEELDRLHHQADEILSRAESDHQHDSSGTDELPQADTESGEVVVSDAKRQAEESKKLVRMGINTAVAIGLHNFPEGLATFVAALDNPRVGGVLAFAIGIHNIPEGLCVALPVYYATGSRTKAFWWAILSGASEPFAALLGWAVLANSFTHQVYAILFGLVAGMMVVISTRELLPTAHRYDPNDTVVTFSFIFGMGVMAMSLILFLL